MRQEGEARTIFAITQPLHCLQSFQCELGLIVFVISFVKKKKIVRI